jgi:hypothetical protein
VRRRRSTGDLGTSGPAASGDGSIRSHAEPLETRPPDVSRTAFTARFPDDSACARHLYEKRWPNGFVCPKCQGAKAWTLDSTGIIDVGPAGGYIWLEVNGVSSAIRTFYAPEPTGDSVQDAIAIDSAVASIMTPLTWRSDIAELDNAA